jgi:hypothetical protein
MTHTPNQITISVTDYLTLLGAAEFGAEKAEGFKAPWTVRCWQETVARLSNRPLPSTYATQAECDAAYLADFADQCAIHGAD